MVYGEGMAEKSGWEDNALEFECPFEEFALIYFAVREVRGV